MNVSRIDRDQVYATVGHRQLKLDLYWPQTRPKGAVLLIHGGGWRSGKKDDLALAASCLADAGFLAIPAEYRLLGEAPWPSQITDVRAAIRWVRTKCAEFRVDPAAIVLEGFSAGGHLSLLSAGLPESCVFDDPDLSRCSARVAAVGAWYAPVELSTLSPGEGVTAASRLLADAATEERARLASPIHSVSVSFPPTFLVHGSRDKLISASASMRFYTQVQRHGIAAELHLVAEQAHDFLTVPSAVPPLQAAFADFLDRTVIDPQRFMSESTQYNKFARA